jgi:ABC-2 type transport system permease protein
VISMDAFTIMFKDLRLLSRDRRALVILVAMPMVIIAIVGSSTGRLRANREQSRQGLTIEVADFDQSKTATRLTGFLASYNTVLVRRAEIGDLGDAAELQRFEVESPTDSIDIRLVIQPGFESRIRELSTTLLTSPDETTRKGGLAAVNLKLISNETAADPVMEGLARSLVKLSLQNAILPILAEKVPSFRGAARDSVIPEAWEESPAAQAAPIDTGNRVYQFFIPSYTVLFVFFLVNIMGRSFIGERDTGTLRRLRIAPIAPVAILMGKTLPFFVLSLAQTIILMVSGRLLFDMSWGPQPLLLIPIMLCTSATATALGLMFSTLAKTESQVSSIGNLILLSSAGISGCLVPRAWMPPMSQKISLFTPHAWALDAYSELLTKEMPRISTIGQSCGMLLVFSGLFFIVGLYRFRAT